MDPLNYPIIPGAEAFYYEGNHIGILLCHGFNATPQSVREIGIELMKKGYSVYAPRLAGHGTDPQDFREATRHDWYQTVKDAIQVLRDRCHRVIVVGQSMGGTLALKSALIDQVDAVVTINAALSVPGYECYTDEESCHFIDESTPDICAPHVHEIIYKKVPTSAIRELLALIEEVRPCVETINVPVCVVYSAVDHVVPPESSVWLYNQIRENRQIEVLANSYHVATMDHDKNELVKIISTFANGISS